MLTDALSLIYCTHAPSKAVDKTFGIAITPAVFLNEILNGIGVSNPALLIPHCIYPIANQKTFASLLVKLVLKIADVDDMLPPKTIILTLVSVP